MKPPWTNALHFEQRSRRSRLCSEVDALIPRINEIAMQLWGLPFFESGNSKALGHPRANRSQIQLINLCFDMMILRFNVRPLLWIVHESAAPGCKQMTSTRRVDVIFELHVRPKSGKSCRESNGIQRWSRLSMVKYQVITVDHYLGSTPSIFLFFYKPWFINPGLTLSPWDPMVSQVPGKDSPLMDAGLDSLSMARREVSLLKVFKHANWTSEIGWSCTNGGFNGIIIHEWDNYQYPWCFKGNII